MWQVGGGGAEPARQRPRGRAKFAVNGVAYSADSQVLALCTATQVTVWDVKQQQQQPTTPTHTFVYADIHPTGGDTVGDAPAVQCLGFAHRHGGVLLGGGKRGLWCFDLATSTGSFHAMRSECLTMDLAYAKNGGGEVVCVFGMMDGRLCVYRGEPGPALLSAPPALVIRDHGPVCCVSLNDAGTLLVSCTDEKYFTRWDLAAEQQPPHQANRRPPRQTGPFKHPAWVWACLANRANGEDGGTEEYISCWGRTDCTLYLWRGEEEAPRQLLPAASASSSPKRFESYAVSKDFSRILLTCTTTSAAAAAAPQYELVMVNIATAEWTVVRHFPVAIQDVSFAGRNNSACAVGLADGAAYVLDLSMADKERVLALMCALARRAGHDFFPMDVVRNIIRPMLCWQNNNNNKRN